MNHAPGYIKWKSCSRKKRYRTEEQARKIVKKYKDQPGAPTRYYYCKLCKGWHLTKK